MIIAAVAVVLLAVYARAASSPPVDFGAYFGAAVALREGRSPYGDALAWRAAGYVTGGLGRQPTDETAYVYPPALALALVPLASLPLTVAHAVWVGLLFASVLGTAWCLAVLVTDRRDSRFWAFVALLTLALVVFKPVRGALTFSKQVDPVIMLQLAAAALAFTRRRDGLAGVLLGLAVAVKPFLAVLALGFLWKGAYRATLSAGVVAVVIGVGPLLALGLLPDFLAAASHWSGPAMVASPVSQSAASLLLRTLTVQPYTMPLIEAPWLVIPLQVLIGAALVAVLGLAVSRSREQPPLVLALEWGLGIAALLIFGPLTEEHHLAYLALGLTATLAAALSAWSLSDGARRIAVGTGPLVLFFVLPGTQLIAWGFYGYLDGPIPPPASFATSLFLYATVAAGVLNLWTLRLVRALRCTQSG